MLVSRSCSLSYFQFWYKLLHHHLKVRKGTGYVLLFDVLVLKVSERFVQSIFAFCFILVSVNLYSIIFTCSRFHFFFIVYFILNNKNFLVINLIVV